MCAPIDGTIVLGAGTPDRLVLAIDGDSCQDGAGDPQTASFTGLAQLRRQARHRQRTPTRAAHGLAAFLEDAADRDRMTLIGRITR